MRRFTDFLQQRGPRFIHKEQHRRCDPAFDQADGQMDWLHQCQKRAKGQLRDAGQRRLQHNRKRAQLQGDDTAQDRGQHQLPGRLAPAAAQEGAVDQVVPDKAAVKAHIPDVRPQGEQPPVGKEQALDC